ncbi:NAD-dependent epimerase/dehydratase family protein [Edaphobacter modestus]|uniref:Nucleoside-diphosphate-sugar epimerase n=1 Tax=Edaphobacter modestus TaxID=388466 RepID=A0A4Q7YZ11_9BACT|nr:NAD-dependent epimerase/dehydratase family protein [Edaphobacter modestus]RZU42435.1 nucleoside-diphosphate-sugar epimerase [Edaphobacter modestus]
MRVAVIGGTGHIGSYLTPALVEAGHTVLCISRGLKTPYRPHAAFNSIRNITLDRDVEEAAGNFGEKIASLDPQVVIDLTCYRVESAEQLVLSLQGRIEHLLHCGTIWVHGPSCEVPTTEEATRSPFGDYGLHKLAIEQFLLSKARREAFPATVLHPGHLVGIGWNPLNPQGNFNPSVFSDLAHGKNLALPNLGMETVHHVHADDVAQAFMRAMARRSVALGESFHVVSPAAMTLRGFAERMAAWFDRPANLTFVAWEQWKISVSEKDARSTWDHIAHSPNCSIAKARTLLGYAPRYTSLEAVQEAVTAMQERGVVTTA